MFYLTHRLGSYLLGTAPTEFTMSLSWEWFSNLGAGVLLPLVAGSLLCGIVFATIGYFSIRYLWRWKVIKNWEARKDLRLKRKQGI
jgi:hypothetical protein